MRIKCTTCNCYVVLPKMGEAVIPDCEVACNFESSFEYLFSKTINVNGVPTFTRYWRAL